MTGFDIALGIVVVVLIVIAAAYLYWKRGSRPATPGDLTYRQLKDEARFAPRSMEGEGLDWEGPDWEGLDSAASRHVS